ncbi:hypothetical protein ACFC6L_16125 [Kitasatospora phosalacinea]|uniref:hypothetical protein n=1 Tax=Kitasatospora phosalacinea TaxID=2065 RepID=UPI0035DB3A15
MNPEELRAGLPEAADLVGPVQVDVERVVGRVRRRHRARSVVVGGVVTVLAAAVVLAVVRPGGRPGNPTVSPGKDGPGPDAVAAVGEPLYVCGEPLPHRDAVSARGGVTLSVGAVRKVSGTTGPAIEAVFTADRTFSASSVPPEHLEVLYVADDVVVGGGPLLDRPGSRKAQVWDPVGYELLLRAGSPTVQQVGDRNELCPSLEWPQVWADPGRYEVVLLAPEPVDSATGRPDSPPDYLVAKAPLSR